MKTETKEIIMVMVGVVVIATILVSLFVILNRNIMTENEEPPYDSGVSDTNIVLEVSYNNATGKIEIQRPDKVNAGVSIRVFANDRWLGSGWLARGEYRTYHNHVPEPLNFTIVILEPSEHLTYTIENNSENYNFELRKDGY
jgi:hypothetical protein